METVGVASQFADISLPLFRLWQLAVLLLVLLPAAAVFGYYVGRTRRRHRLARNRDIDASLGETTAATMTALLGLLLAFSFGNALSLHQSYKATIVEEAAALGTAFLRADYLAEPGRTELKQAILDYTKTRIFGGSGLRQSRQEVFDFLEASLAAQARLWPVTLAATAEPTPAPIRSFVAGAVNEALDAHLYRVASVTNPVSEAVHLMLLAVALVSLFLLGNRNGLIGRDLTWRTFLLSGFLVIVMIMILDTQRSNAGFITASESALRATIVEMEQALAP